MPLTSIDLFCGAGGLSEGFTRAGFKTLLATDFDEQALQTYSFNHPDVPTLGTDIRKIRVEDLADAAHVRPGQVDVVAGGPPCQGFSLAGPRLPSDPKNELVLDFLAVVRFLRPRAVVFENVVGIVSMLSGAVVEVLHREFASLGYGVVSGILNAAGFGVPQSRPRFILIGVRDLASPVLPTATHAISNGSSQASLFSEAWSPQALTVEDALRDLPTVKQGEGQEDSEHDGRYLNEYQRDRRGHRRPGALFNHRATRHSLRVEERYQAIPPGQTNAAVPVELRTNKINVFRLSPTQPARTVTCNFRTDLLHPWLPRGLTVREAARLQSFDDDYKFFGNLTRKAKWVTQDDQVGNAVPPLLAEALAHHLARVLK